MTHECEIMYSLSSCDQLTSLDSPVVSYDRSFFFSQAEYCSLVCVHCITFMLSSVSGHLGCLHISAFLSKAAVQACRHLINIQIYFHRCGITRSCGGIATNFLWNCHTVFHSGCGMWFGPILKWRHLGEDNFLLSQ